MTILSIPEFVSPSYPKIIKYKYLKRKSLLLVNDEEEFNSVLGEFFYVFHKRGFYDRIIDCWKEDIYPSPSWFNTAKKIWKVFLIRTKEESSTCAVDLVRDLFVHHYWLDNLVDKNGDSLDIEFLNIEQSCLFMSSIEMIYIEQRTTDLRRRRDE